MDVGNFRGIALIDLLCPYLSHFIKRKSGKASF